ncbi:hypothetical protein G7Y89_g14141 [Cudoniella acicularis]|uniref:Uncharacterized protein n=1 Tax=Cudoniella acicularis TaxID=354080 RepID=A0A8H4R5M0_9HELO|nr:hypothetical protein G7Y89_g14141 [Cudoniella acicularis]
MASTPTTFDDVLVRFKSRLSAEELENFQVTSLEDVKLAVKYIQDEQGRRLEMMNFTRIQAFLEAMEQFVLHY